MRTIEAKEITALVRELCMKANYVLPESIRQSYVDGEKNEQSPLGKTIFGKMIENCDIACKNSVPICQDCGMAIVFVEVGQDVHITGGLLEDAVNEGVRQGYVDGYLRLSVVRDPLLDRSNTNDNTMTIGGHGLEPALSHASTTKSMISSGFAAGVNILSALMFSLPKPFGSTVT